MYEREGGIEKERVSVCERDSSLLRLIEKEIWKEQEIWKEKERWRESEKERERGIKIIYSSVIKQLIIFYC